MKKLTQQKAQTILEKVYRQRKIHPSYRLGQGIFNLLPDDIANDIRGGMSDFFYWTDEVTVLHVFYRECVEC